VGRNFQRKQQQQQQRQQQQQQQVALCRHSPIYRDAEQQIDVPNCGAAAVWELPAL
jgi:hypothetical protein